MPAGHPRNRGRPRRAQCPPPGQEALRVEAVACDRLGLRAAIDGVAGQALPRKRQLGLDEEPHWAFKINERLGHLATTAGLPLVVAIATIEAAVGLGVLTRHRRVSLLAGMVVSAVYWAVRQQFAQLFTGSATDIGAGPLYVLLG